MLDSFGEKILAVCISWKAERWSIPEIPFYCLVADGKPFPRVMTKERVAHLASRRNEAVKDALEAYSDTQNILMIDSYYLAQTSQVRDLLHEYASRSKTEECIVGASTWFQDKTRIRPRIRFWDSWITPEARDLRLPIASHENQPLRVRAVGACYVFPRRVWEAHPYGVPLSGGEHVSLCEGSGLPVWLSLGVQLWRDPVVYPWAKRVRQTLHLRRIRGFLDEQTTPALTSSSEGRAK